MSPRFSAPSWGRKLGSRVSVVTKIQQLRLDRQDSFPLRRTGPQVLLFPEKIGDVLQVFPYGKTLRTFILALPALDTTGGIPRYSP